MRPFTLGHVDVIVEPSNRTFGLADIVTVGAGRRFCILLDKFFRGNFVDPNASCSAFRLDPSNMSRIPLFSPKDQPPS